MTMSERIEVGKALDLTEKRFDRLVAKYRVKPIGKVSTTSAWWHCECDCGVEFDTMANSLTRGRTRSCGCYSRELFMAKCVRRKGESA